MIVAGTGHRPNKLGGYKDYELLVYPRLVSLAKAALLKYKPEKVISGMALGWDQALADATIQLGYPLCAAVPFSAQDSQWPTASRQFYQELLQQASEVHLCSTGGYSPFKMQVRNEWMVDASDFVLALWDGTPGGTANCISYIVKQSKPFRNLWSSWQRYAFK